MYSHCFFFVSMKKFLMILIILFRKNREKPYFKYSRNKWNDLCFHKQLHRRCVVLQLEAKCENKKVVYVRFLK